MTTSTNKPVKETIDLPKIFHGQFTPERWSKIETLRALLGVPLPTTRESYKALDACLGHLRKFQVFDRIAARIVTNLPKDREELERYGASRNSHCEEFGALMEAMVSELYSALDGLRHFLWALYPNVQGMQNKSNEKFFRRAKEHAYGPGFPEEVRLFLERAYDEWFPNLRKFRSEIMHGTVGSFHLDGKKGTVSCFNNGLGTQSRCLVIDDIVEFVRSFYMQVTALIEGVAAHFVSQLAPVPRMYPCGMYLGRMYIRMVSPEPNLTFRSGQCASWDWFENETELFCPLAKRCEAYGRKWPGGSAAVIG